MRSGPAVVFSRLFLPQPLDPELVAQFFTRMAAAHGVGPSAVTLETRATSAGIAHLIGCPAAEVPVLGRQLAALIPGAVLARLDDYPRRPVYTAKRLASDGHGLPLGVADPEPITRSTYTALSRRLNGEETLVLQLVLGRATPPRHVPSKVPDPRKRSLLTAVTSGIPDAPNEVRAAMRERAAEHHFEVDLRIGVAAGEAGRRTRLGRELASAFAVAEAPGVRLSLKPDNPNNLNTATPSRWGALDLSVSELVAFCGWPLGDGDLPGLPPAHPKMLRADPAVESRHRLFALAMAPGDNRSLGISARDALHHGIAIGSTGSGKTTLLENLIKADIAAGAPVLVLDPKAQMPDQLLAAVPEERWRDVVIIDATAERPIGFNPLDATGRDPDVVADGILAVFKKAFADGWGHRTADIFSASLRTLARAGLSAPEPYTLVDLVRLWTDTKFRTTVIGSLGDSGDVGMASFWAWFESLSPAQRANVLASPMNKVRDILLRPAAVKILGQPRPPFRLRDMFRARKVVLVPLNEGLIGPLTAELIGSLVIAEVWQATQERAREKHHDRNIGFVYVDEADRFMSSLTVSLPDALARSRSLSVAWFLAVQFWEQMPSEMRSAVQHNARTKVVFKQEAFEDAHMLARQAPKLVPEDFMALGLYQAYVRPVAKGITTGWALAKTLPPTPGEHDPAVVSAASYHHHRPAPLPTAPRADETAEPVTTTTTTEATGEAYGRTRRPRGGQS